MKRTKFWTKYKYGYKIPFDSKPFQSKIPSQLIVSQGGEELLQLEVKEILKKGAIRKVQPSKRVCKQPLPCKKEKWGPKYSDKFETNDCIYAIFLLQNGRFAK